MTSSLSCRSLTLSLLLGVMWMSSLELPLVVRSLRVISPIGRCRHLHSFSTGRVSLTRTHISPSTDFSSLPTGVPNNNHGKKTLSPSSLVANTTTPIITTVALTTTTSGEGTDTGKSTGKSSSELTSHNDDSSPSPSLSLLTLPLRLLLHLFFPSIPPSSHNSSLFSLMSRYILYFFRVTIPWLILLYYLSPSLFAALSSLPLSLIGSPSLSPTAVPAAVTEVAYSTFLRLLDTHPEKMTNIRLDADKVAFTVDSVDYLSRIASAPPPLLEKLLAAKLPFHSLSPSLSPSVMTGKGGSSLVASLSLFLQQIGAFVFNVVLYGLLLRLSLPLVFQLSRRIQEWRERRAGGVVGGERERGETDHLARLHNPLSLSGGLTKKPLSFEDIAGLSDAKKQMREVVEMLRESERYTAAGARIPCGVLLVGPPGSGKTLLARVMASSLGGEREGEGERGREREIPFLSCTGSEFMEMYVGRGPARIRSLFEDALKLAREGRERRKQREKEREKEKERGRGWGSSRRGGDREGESENKGGEGSGGGGEGCAIIFIDEIDSIGRARGTGSMWSSSGSHEEQGNTLNQLLTCMDGLDTSNNGVIVVAATNRVDTLDPALLRAGRFDRIIQCPLPDRNDRRDIFQLHSRKLNLASDVDFDKLAKMTPGSSGADIATIVNEAAIRTVRRKGSRTNLDDFEDALKDFYASRSISLSGLAEIASSGLNRVPEWFRALTAALETVPGEILRHLERVFVNSEAVAQAFLSELCAQCSSSSVSATLSGKMAGEEERAEERERERRR